MKVCCHCKKEKPKSEFHKNKRNRDGLQTECKECHLSINTEWKSKNAGKMAQYKKKWMLNNPEKQKMYLENWRQKNKSLSYQKRSVNLEKERERGRRRRLNVFYRLHISISRGMCKSIKSNKGGRKWEDAVGYNIEKLKKHLQKQFLPGMTWDNYGEWQIDHIIPISAFNFTTIEHLDFKRCWALKNLQPMWAIDNARKGPKLCKPFQPALQLSCGDLK